MNRYGKLLPIGSIVKLNNMNKKIMITGILCTSETNKNIVKDYCGCFYPEGILTGNKLVLFDVKDIDELIYVGYVDNEEREFKKSLNDNIEVLKSALNKYKENNYGE